MASKATNPPLSKRFTKSQIVLSIGRNKGIKTAICKELDCTIHQLNMYLRIHSELIPLLKEAKQELVSLAEEAILDNLTSKNEGTRQKAAEFVLKTLGKEEYTEQPSTQINVISDKEVEIKNIFGI